MHSSGVQRGGSRLGYNAYDRPPIVNAYDADDAGVSGHDGRRQPPPQQQQLPYAQPLRRRGGPVPAPASLLSVPSSHPSLHSTPIADPYAASSPASSVVTASSTAASTHSSSGGTAATSPPSHPQKFSAQHRVSQTPLSTTADSSSTTSTTTTTTITATPSSVSTSRSRSSGHRGRHPSSADTPLDRTAVPTPLNGASDARAPSGTKTRSAAGGRAAPRALSRRARNQSSRSPTPEERRQHNDGGNPPRVPPTRGPGSAPRQRPPLTAALEMGSRGGAAAAMPGPTIVRATSPAAASPSSVRSLGDGEARRRSGTRDSNPYPPGTVHSRSSATSQSSALPPHMRQETGVPSPTPALTPAPTAATRSTTPSEKVVTAGPVIMSNAERKKAEREARKQLRNSMYNGNIKVHGYVAQTAYAQKNPFRRQDFAEFAANPKYQPPDGFDVYAQAMATRVYGLEVSRASQGEFMMQRLVDAAHPATAEERAEMEALLSTTLEKLQVGDWFYKWTRINHVHQRYVWLNLQRGTLMWSLSPKQSVVLNEEIKLSTVTSITPDCLQLEAPMRVFYRMTINTPDRCISLATEIRKKFDVWYRVLLQLTAPNLVYGVPGVWGRPSSSVNTTGRGAASRWASRFSPLDAVVDDTARHMGHDCALTQGLLSSSD